jgi:hypothetical protein
MKNVLLLVHDDEGQEARLQAALDLTRALDGHLNCLDVTVYPEFVGDIESGAGTAMLINGPLERESRNKEALSARLAHEDVRWDWNDTTGHVVSAVLEAATLADIIVLDRNRDRFAYPALLDATSRILSHARAPALAVGSTLRRLELGRALIAWDGQASCAATMRACVPLLRRSESVEIFCVRDGGVPVSPEDAATYLSRHGIHATVRLVEDGLNDADRHIAAAADDFGADYIMMGAFSHGLLMETFGGVTKRMLQHSQLPLVLGH